MGEPASKSLALIVAHPDDDAFGCSGSVALHGEDPEFRYVLVHATDGGAGDIAPGFPATRETLGAIRRIECENAWRAHGRMPDRHDWLDYADGAVADVPFDELVARIAVVLRQERPQVVVTFGPDGITGHPDHITIGRATDTAFHQVRADGGPGLRRLLHGAMKASVYERWNTARPRFGLPQWNPGRVYDLRPVPDAQIGIEVDVSTVAHRILAGLLEHRSQRHVIMDPGQDLDIWKHSMGREHLVLAWPPRKPGDPVLNDLFEGL